MIPSEAIEAAAKALWQTNQHDDSWVGEYPEYMDYLRAEATKALEAAAPHIRAQVLDEVAAEVDEGVPAHRQDQYAAWLRSRAQEELGSK